MRYARIGWDAEKGVREELEKMVAGETVYLKGVMAETIRKVVGAGHWPDETGKWEIKSCAVSVRVKRLV